MWPAFFVFTDYRPVPVLSSKVVRTIKRNLNVDWTESHRDDVMAGIRAAVKSVLRQRDVKAEDLEPLTKAVMEQAAALYADRPVAA